MDTDTTPTTLGLDIPDIDSDEDPIILEGESGHGSINTDKEEKEEATSKNDNGGRVTFDGGDGNRVSRSSRSNRLLDSQDNHTNSAHSVASLLSIAMEETARRSRQSDDINDYYSSDEENLAQQQLDYHRQSQREMELEALKFETLDLMERMSSSDYNMQSYEDDVRSLSSNQSSSIASNRDSFHGMNNRQALTINSSSKANESNNANNNTNTNNNNNNNNNNSNSNNNNNNNNNNNSNGNNDNDNSGGAGEKKAAVWHTLDYSSSSSIDDVMSDHGEAPTTLPPRPLRTPLSGHSSSSSIALFSTNNDSTGTASNAALPSMTRESSGSSLSALPDKITVTNKKSEFDQKWQFTALDLLEVVVEYIREENLRMREWKKTEQTVSEHASSFLTTEALMSHTSRQQEVLRQSLSKNYSDADKHTVGLNKLSDILAQALINKQEALEGDLATNDRLLNSNLGEQDKNSVMVGAGDGASTGVMDLALRGDASDNVNVPMEGSVRVEKTEKGDTTAEAESSAFNPTVSSLSLSTDEMEIGSSTSRGREPSNRRRTSSSTGQARNTSNANHTKPPQSGVVDVWNPYRAFASKWLKRLPLLLESTECAILAAEEDGEIEEDLPMFSADTDVMSMGVTNFMVINKQTYEPLVHVRIEQMDWSPGQDRKTEASDSYESDEEDAHSDTWVDNDGGKGKRHSTTIYDKDVNTSASGTRTRTRSSSIHIVDTTNMDIRKVFTASTNGYNVTDRSSDSALNLNSLAASPPIRIPQPEASPLHRTDSNGSAANSLGTSEKGNKDKDSKVTEKRSSFFSWGRSSTSTSKSNSTTELNSADTTTTASNLHTPTASKKSNSSSYFTFSSLYPFSTKKSAQSKATLNTASVSDNSNGNDGSNKTLYDDEETANHPNTLDKYTSGLPDSLEANQGTDTASRKNQPRSMSDLDSTSAREAYIFNKTQSKFGIPASPSRRSKQSVSPPVASRRLIIKCRLPNIQLEAGGTVNMMHPPPPSPSAPISATATNVGDLWINVKDIVVGSSTSDSEAERSALHALISSVKAGDEENTQYLPRLQYPREQIRREDSPTGSPSSPLSPGGERGLDPVELTHQQNSGDSGFFGIMEDD